ncbi:GTP-binding protein [Gemmiger formicilis]|uniref:GTP-binding protein n=1 Tax=Gemmiger formicilis TaxID=745368 RepID=UPI003999E482
MWLLFEFYLSTDIDNIIFLFSGASAVGKTAVLKSLLPLLDQSGESPCVCKIDCLQSKDAVTFQKMKYPCVTGLSGDICPDHFLVSNLPELWQWTDAMQRNLLVIETAGLCHRCSPATKHMLAGCVVDCTVSCKAPGQLGPMLTQADFVVLTKVDMISQAEMEIICWQIGQINPQAKIFPVDALAGYGIDLLAQWLLTQPRHMDFTEDTLRHTMPSGVCSYCVGETRVGTAYQQGVVGKIDFKENAICKQ